MTEKKGSTMTEGEVDEDVEEELSMRAQDENVQRQIEVLEHVREQMEIQRPLLEQDHPLLLEDGTNVCDVAKDYVEHEKGQDSWIMSQKFDEVLPILQAMNIDLGNRRKRQAATEIVKFVKHNCGCIPKRRPKSQ